MKCLAPSLAAVLVITGAAGCRKSDEAAATTTPDDAAQGGLECDHDSSSDVLLPQTWPYPADHRDLRWVDGYRKTRLKLKPTHAAFVTATVTWKKGDLIEVLDSQLHITKPRRLIAKRDIYIKRKVWDQGIQVERTYLAAAEGGVADFLFYNSRGLCLVGTDGGPGWTPCTLDDTFENLSAEHPHPCSQFWWVQVQKRKVDKGWMIVEGGLMERVPPSDAAR